VQLRRVRCSLHAYLLDTRLRALRCAVKAKFDPSQPRVPAGNPDGGQWTGTGGARDSTTVPGRPQGTAVDQLIHLAGDITGFTRHGINQTIARGVSPTAMLDAVTNPLQIIPQANGTTRYIGAGAVVVLNPAGGVITVWRR
jgi:hypothetical protein